MTTMASLQGLGSFVLYFGASLLAAAAYVLIYMAVTPHHEAKLIQAGNAAAAVSLGGALLGFTLPLASAVVNSVSLLDMAIWSAIALVAQLGAFLAASLLLRGLSKRIEAGDLAAGFAVASISVAVGLLNAASMTY